MSCSGAASAARQQAGRCAPAAPRRQSVAPIQTQRRRQCAAAAGPSSGSGGGGGSGGGAISVQGVDLTFTGRGLSKRVLDGASLEVPRGCLHMLLGANGCGKSTLLRVLAGLFRPDAGTVHVDAPCGFVFQNPDHQVVMPTVAADVAFGLGRYNLSPAAVHAAVQHALQQVGLAEFAERPSSSLSGGQKQRVAIAGAVAECPRVLLLDELTTFLDYEDQENVLQCVRAIVDSSRQPGGEPQAAAAATGVAQQGQQQQQGGALDPSLALEQEEEWQQQQQRGVTALWVTHRLEELEYADSVSYMEGGRIVFSGSPDEMRAYMRRLGALV